MSPMKLEVNKPNKGFMIALASAVVLSFIGIIIKSISFPKLQNPFRNYFN